MFDKSELGYVDKLVGYVIGVRKSKAFHDDTGFSGNLLYRVLLQNNSVKVITEATYTKCNKQYHATNKSKQFARHQRIMDAVMERYSQRERIRTLNASTWGEPTGWATVVSSGTATDLQNMAPAGLDVRQALHELREHIGTHLEMNNNEMGTLLDDGCRCDVIRAVSTKKRKRETHTEDEVSYSIKPGARIGHGESAVSSADVAQSLSFDRYHQTHAQHNAENQRCDLSSTSTLCHRHACT